MSNNKIKKQDDTLTQVVKKYIARGFGSMNKNDFEVFIFNQILSMDDYNGKTNYELSLLLRIPESKVRRLRYEAALHNSENTSTDAYKNKAYQLISNAKLRTADERIVIQVEDVLLKSYISHILKKDGRIIDSSHNNELIVIHKKDFSYLAAEIYPKDEVDTILKEAKKAFQKDIDWNEVIVDSISAIATPIVGEAVGGAIKGITSLIPIDLSPSNIIKIIKEKLSNNKQ